jgi:FkbM family methyltransferase
MKALVKALMARTPYSIVRNAAANRFQAIGTCLKLLRTLGYRPRIVIDGGAHLGHFAMEAKMIFPEVTVYMVEPQPACRSALERLASERGFVLYSCALASEASSASGSLQLTVDEKPTTGAFITADAGPGAMTASVQASTLDCLFAAAVTPEDRAFLKLDLQGYELEALGGGERVLRSIEVVLTEVSFFAQAYVPSIPTLIAFFSKREFELFDIAALSGRRRDDRLKQGDLVFVKRGSPLLSDTSWS